MGKVLSYLPINHVTGGDSEVICTFLMLLRSCSRAEVKNAVLACQKANFLHCYSSPETDMTHSVKAMRYLML